MKTNRKNRLWLWAAAVLVLAGLGALAWLLIPGLRGPAADYWPTNSWRSGAPEEQGFDSAKLAAGLQALKKNNVAIDSLLIIRNGYVVLDAAFYPYETSLPHDLASVTKSVMTTLISIAADQGTLQLDQPMVSFFPDRTIANLDDRKKSITIRHLVRNVNGMESGCLWRDEPTLDAMRSQPDWVQAALDREMAHDPGTSFCYDSPGMHLLSAILQEATGMTALDFARQYLFQPLGIREAAWESDPQGYTHGWGDLHLKPGDAAKIGYLWLKNGVWEGKQIVSANWVADAVKAQTRMTGESEDYGYGWWVSEEGYFASGRGGQNIRVYPSLNAVIVATAQGLEFSQLDPLLTTAFADPNEPLPANPAGVSELNDTLAGLAQGPVSNSVAAPADLTRAITGKGYACEPNGAGVTTVRLEFNDPEVVTITIQLNDTSLVWPIGLAGKYRLSPEGQGLRGYWEDPQTFIIEAFDWGLYTRRLHFEGNHLEASLPEYGLTLACQIQTP